MVNEHTYLRGEIHEDPWRHAFFRGLAANLGADFDDIMIGVAEEYFMRMGARGKDERDYCKWKMSPYSVSMKQGRLLLWEARTT